MNSTVSSLVAHAVHFITGACARLSSLSENPLFSSVLTLHILLFLYFPPFLLKLVFSPVTILAFLILVALLWSGSPHGDGRNLNPERGTARATTQEEPLFVHGREYNFRAELAFLGSSACLIDDSFVEWDVKAPLDVIYEGYEGEEAGEGKPVSNKDGPVRSGKLEKTSSLEVYYPEADSDTSSEGKLGSVGEGGWAEGSRPFEWEGEEREGLIEIELDFGGGRGSVKAYEDSHVEEENMIEIDLSVGDD
ncbi:hypothetical protein MLD38_027515 [Melastoma candidum]|uniref:Uncharacterized protein n=1 Tax=Melastoma candidum TaxID=119954 RepID=A0ACB9P215_9MYRT|nr:hypothetical protein MLD38_027515 [Melastoma candidum]